MKLSKKLCITAKKSFSLVLALTLMLSICAVSGMSLNVFAATSLDQKIYINLNKNKEWNGFSSVTCRFAQDDGTVLKTEKVSKDPSSGVFEATAPSGATRIELSSGVNFTLPETTVAKDFRRIYLYNSNNTYNEAYAYSWVSDTDFNAEWPGAAMTKTSSDSDYYYVDVKSSHKNVIFSNKGETQTSDLGINDSYSADNALYDASKSQWTNPFIKTIDISGATGDTEFYLSTDGSFKESKYLSVQAPDKQSKATYKTVYVSNDDWKSLTKVYATFDYNDAYEGTVELTKDTRDTKVSGSVVFSGKIPAGALLRFHPNEHNLNGASSATSYPTGSGYDGLGYNDNTATYVKTARGEGWTKFSEIDNVNYGAVVENSFKDNPDIVGVDATYFDYWSDMEQEKGYLQCQGNDKMYDYWYQFDNFNKYISDIALDHQSDWKYPLYFGNMYKGGEHYKEFTDHVAGLTNINDYNDNYYYAVNNANGMAWGDGNYNQSLQGLMYNRLDSKGNLQVANGVKAPYFDAEALSTATYNDKRVANVYKSSFPFRATTDGDGVTTYEFTSKNATDNIYFTWDGLTPKKINYGAGETYGVHDDLGKFGGTENGYGVFPFNNTQNTSAGKGTNCNLNYGFGVRLDIDFRVPKGGKLADGADGKDVTFNFTGDDDLWVYIGEDSTGANAELALDLGGDHKEASGSINFNTMKATADDVFADYSPSSSSTTVTVPEGEFWVKTGDYNNFCLNVWQDTKVGVYNEDGYYVDPYEISDGFYKFKKDLLGSNTEVNFCKWKNMGTGGTLKANLKLSDLYGKMWNGDGTPYTGDALSHPIIRKPVTKTINNGVQLDPNKTYHMVVFYMERGEAESNFSVNFTMTPANNDLKVTKALDTGDVVSEISDDLKANETFDYTIKENGNDTSGKSYKLTKSDENISNETLSNSGFTLKDDYMADFDNSFKTGNEMKVNESTKSSKLTYTTNWELVNNRVGSTIDSGSTTNSEFKLVDDKDDSAYAQLQLNYTNSIVTAPLEISKDVVGEDGKTDYDTDQQFTFAIALDFDGDGSTYDYKTYPLEYQLKEKNASGYSNTAYRTSKDGSFTIKKGESIKLLNIPVGATYKITEKRVIGYVPYKVGNQSFKGGTFEGTLAETGNVLNFVNKVNPTNIAISVNKTLDGQAYSGSKFGYTLTGLGSMDTTKLDTDGKTFIKTNSAATVSTNLKTPDKNGKVEFKNLKLVTAGVYRFKITEALAEGENASDYKMDTNTWLAEIELLENGEVTAPTYIKVSSSAIKDKTDAELAGYFNDPTSVKENEALFANETTHGSATVNKKNQTGGNVSDTEFAVMKVSDKDIFTADDINTIINDASMKTHMVSKKTDSNGQAVFDNLTIFKDGQGEFTKTNGKVVWNESSDNYITGTSKYQTYCLFEYKPSEGYTPNYTLTYFTLPVEGKYDVTYNYVDGAITMPQASGEGMNGYVVLGLSVAGLAVTMFTGYAIYYGKVRKKRRAGRRK